MLRMNSALTAAEEAVVSECITCGITVHRLLGPGFRELIYHRAFVLELQARGMRFETEKPIMVRYKEWQIPGQKVDLIVENVVLIDLKTVPRLRALHRHQVQSYLRTTQLKIGLLMNFRSTLLKDGLRRVTL